MWSLQSLGVPLVICDKISLMIRKPRHVITSSLLDNKKKSLFNGMWRFRKRRWYEKYGYPPNFNSILFNVRLPNIRYLLCNVFQTFVLEHLHPNDDSILIFQTFLLEFLPPMFLFEVPPIQTIAIPFEFPPIQNTAISCVKDPHEKIFLEEQRKEGIAKSLIKIGKDAKKRPKYAEKRIQTLFRGKNAIQSRNKHYLKPKCKY